MSQLPQGLFVCADCGDVRGKTPDGMLSVCLCQGVVCTWCGARGRRPISDHYDPRAGWLHTPYFMAAHACPPGTEPRDGKRLHVLPADDDLQAYSAAMTRLALAELEARVADRRGPIEDDLGADDTRMA